MFLSTAMGVLNTSVTQVRRSAGEPWVHDRRLEQPGAPRRTRNSSRTRVPGTEVQATPTGVAQPCWAACGRFFLPGPSWARTLASRVAVWTLLLPAGLLLLLAFVEPAADSVSLTADVPFRELSGYLRNLALSISADTTAGALTMKLACFAPKSRAR